MKKGFAFSSAASFWISTGVVVHVFWMSAAPTMTYPLYAAEWGLTPTETTAIFSVYPFFVVAALTGFGGLSDDIGRRSTMLLGLTSSIVGTLCFAVAPSVAWLFIGRALMGIGAGLSAGRSTAAVVDFAGVGQSRRASSVTTAAQSAGFVSALILGGALIQYAPLPTRLNFWVLFSLLVTLFGAVWFMPRSPAGHASGLKVHVPTVPSELHRPFALAAVAVTTAFTFGVLTLSLGASIAHDLVGSRNAFVNAAILSSFAFTAGVGGILCKDVPSKIAIILGALASAISMTLLSVSVSRHELIAFLAATTSGGLGYSLFFLGGLEVINKAAPPERRAAVFSAMFLIAYLTLGIVALTLGVIATRSTLKSAVDMGVGTIALLGVAALALAVLSSAGPTPVRPVE